MGLFNTSSLVYEIRGVPLGDGKCWVWLLGGEYMDFVREAENGLVSPKNIMAQFT